MKRRELTTAKQALYIRSFVSFRRYLSTNDEGELITIEPPTRSKKESYITSYAEGTGTRWGIMSRGDSKRFSFVVIRAELQPGSALLSSRVCVIHESRSIRTSRVHLRGKKDMHVQFTDKARRVYLLVRRIRSPMQQLSRLSRRVSRIRYPSSAVILLDSRWCVIKSRLAVKVLVTRRVMHHCVQAFPRTITVYKVPD